MYQVEINLNNSNYDGFFEFDSVELAAAKVVGNVYGFDYKDVISYLAHNSGDWTSYQCSKNCGVAFARRVSK